jgi:hypothetical protein
MIRSPGLLVPLLFTALFPDAGISRSRAVAVSAGQDGAVQITLANGKKTVLRKDPGQTGISDAEVEMDGTAAWLVEYNVEGVSYPVAGTLVVWRGGRTIRRFRTGQAIYSWTFYARNKQVAYHAGPLHGELRSHCELHGVASGALVAVWDGDLEAGGDRPAWAEGLSR